MNRKTTLSEPPQKKHRDYGRIVYTGFLGACMTAVLAQPALAAETLWTKASEVMKDVYTQILGISTSVLGALGCDMSVFLRYFPAAETMYDIFVALAKEHDFESVPADVSSGIAILLSVRLLWPTRPGA